MACRFQFINIPHPTGQISPQSRKLAHSHVLRQRHAKQRQSRTEAYQRVRIQKKPGSAVGQLEDQFQSRMLDHCKDPFSALSRPLTPQEYFLLDYWPVSDLMADIHVIVPYTAANCRFFATLKFHQGRILSDWVGLAITDPNLLDTAILLASCQHMLRSNPNNPTLKYMALEYKHRGIQALRKAVDSLGNAASPVTLAQSLALAFDECV
ncbi:hypothetical protein FHETE_5813 [Fusarium heterosporum]|uniref:Uncharacterized protein n=1 Tax=Fusarium heterosporum TaxID=42747 RepID=A0A8H5TD91_FUSHE|nr:hypothetical protein FHETE_5813 [Fusarium heterosporum]